MEEAKDIKAKRNAVGDLVAAEEFLESAVISAAINFRKAEIAAWQKSEVGTDEEVVEAKQEKSRAYLALVNATAALMDEREGHG